MYLYLQLLCIFVIAPNIVLLFLNRKRIHLKSLSVALCVLFIIAVIWDQLSVHLGLWVFSQEEIVGNLFGLPIEEYLFFLFVPLLSINIYLFVAGILSKPKTMSKD
jgi:lycopene cyclase domain-containing protein